MLLQFSVENFRSFRNRAVLSLEASNDSNLGDNVDVVSVNGKDVRVLRSAVLFGANASGKSNLFKALTAAIRTVRASNAMQLGQPLELMMPFLADPDCRVDPCRFEFVFLADGKKYVYGFSATRNMVTAEYLYVYRSSKPSVVFERNIEWEHEYKFTSPATRRELEPLARRNTPNKLLLSTATNWNAQSTRAAYMWFADRIDVYTNEYHDLLPRFGGALTSDQEDGLRAFVMNLMHDADVSIDGYNVESLVLTKEQIAQSFPPELHDLISVVAPEQNLAYHVTTRHHGADEGGNVNGFMLNMEDESNGTQNAFMLSPLLYKTFQAGNALCIDEFDASFHPLLVAYLVSLFHHPNVNKNHAQLIISSHTMELMSLRYYRRDQIYYTQKDPNTAASELYSLDEFSPRTSEDVRKSYLAGKYGSVPWIDGVM